MHSEAEGCWVCAVSLTHPPVATNWGWWCLSLVYSLLWDAARGAELQGSYGRSKAVVSSSALVLPLRLFFIDP